ncbi:pathogen-related protein [Diplodia corticola]|uniref:Pathogen-related protein n=1 Tax=Diplodia corticola TaxID=236234 RepID=A0A1J9R3K3_9PEZI|nr:pathogen-related protein [Diplodia corticola]OJD35192.1 pathogen-related protein [Diplodia corticola]
MAAADAQAPPPEEDHSPVPDYLADADAVLKDQGVKWRYGRPPDYSKTRKVYAETKQMNHEAGSLVQMVENLVKNWEIEASFKPRIEDWRTVDAPNYTFAINGNPPQSAEHMLKVGTYNAIISPNEYYSPENSDFASSHKTFKRMMPTFAWEVLEVYSGPPHVAFRWRHWGTMKNDYVGFNDKGEKVTAKAHGGPIDIQGVTVATVDEKVRLRRVETWFDPMEMFRQIAPQGIVNKEPVAWRVSRTPSPVTNRTATPEAAFKKPDEPAETAQPGPAQPSDSIAVQLAQTDVAAQGESAPTKDALPELNPDTKDADARSHQQQSTSDKLADVPLVCPFANVNGFAQANGTLSESKAEHESEPSVQTLELPQRNNVENPTEDLSTESTRLVQAAQTQATEQRLQPSVPVQESSETAESGLDQLHELEQWHEASDILIDTAPGCEPEKFHDAVDVEHETSTVSSEAGSWTAVTPPASDPPTPRKSTYSSSITSGSEQGQSSNQTSPTEAFFSHYPAHKVHPHPKDMENAVSPEPGEGVAAAPDSEEVRLTHIEMSKITAFECPFLMNRE